MLNFAAAVQLHQLQLRIRLQSQLSKSDACPISRALVQLHMDPGHMCKFDGIRSQFAVLYESSAGAMRSFVWHKDQQAVCDCTTAVMRLAET